LLVSGGVLKNCNYKKLQGDKKQKMLSLRGESTTFGRANDVAISKYFLAFMEKETANNYHCEELVAHRVG
jgi:hypothetical protein